MRVRLAITGAFVLSIWHVVYEVGRLCPHYYRKQASFACKTGKGRGASLPTINYENITGIGRHRKNERKNGCPALAACSSELWFVLLT